MFNSIKAISTTGSRIARLAFLIICNHIFLSQERTSLSRCSSLNRIKIGPSTTDFIKLMRIRHQIFHRINSLLMIQKADAYQFDSVDRSGRFLPHHISEGGKISFG